MQSKLGRVATAAVISGTAEELSGGKFSNGAVTGSFVVMFNDLMHEGSFNEGTQDPDPFPSNDELEKDFAGSFNRNVLQEYSNNPNYLPNSAKEIGEDLLYSGDLVSSKHDFILRPIQVNVKGFDATDARVKLYEGSVNPNYINGLNKVYNPGIENPSKTSFMSNGVKYQYVINYQIDYPL